jgi:signal transduction histidine kinase
VEVAVALGRGYLTVTVRDDGVGFREAGSDDGRVHLGVSGIRERVRAVGGAVSFESGDRAGTRMTATIPL